MPRGRKSQNASQVADDDDAPLSQSQSQTPRRGGSLPAAEAARLAGRVVRYVLAAQGRGEPLRRDKLRQRAVEPQHAGCLLQLLQEADKQLRDVFGMSLEVLPNKRDLLLVNRLPVSAEPLVQEDEAPLQKRGLLVAILALIFMSNGQVHEDTLWRFLNKLGVHKDTKHECFGNVKKLVTEEFKRAGYLKTEEKKQQDRVALLFEWGDAAELAVDRMTVLEFICKIWGEDVRPEDWPDQYEMAKQRQEAAENGE